MKMSLIDYTMSFEKTDFPKETFNTGGTKEEVVDYLVSKGLHVYATGSRATTHFNEDSDYDYVVFDEDYKLRDTFDKDFWTMGDSGNQFADFYSLKKSLDGKLVNVIFVDTKEVFQKYVMATNLIRKVDPETKKERIELFDLIFKEATPF